MPLHKKRPPALTVLTLGGVAALLLLAACAPTTSDTADGEYLLSPSSTNRPSEPSLVTSDPQDPDGLTVEEAQVSQLWAMANSEVGEPAGSASNQGAGAGLADFSEAVAARCYPQLADAEKTELDGLKAAYQSVTGAEAAEPAHSYFVRATELCM